MKNLTLTLSKSWQLCIEQWDWIIEQIKDGSTLDVVDLKIIWMKEHGFDEIWASCFFCEYDVRIHGFYCNECPARKIDENFDCVKREHHYQYSPLAFHAEIHRLYKIYEESEK